jgi:hypothetical protein
MDSWKLFEDNDDKGYGTLYWSDYFLRWMKCLRPFHTMEISSLYMKTIPWKTMIPWAFLQCNVTAPFIPNDVLVWDLYSTDLFSWIKDLLVKQVNKIDSKIMSMYSLKYFAFLRMTFYYL